jgi:hypothetical protein
LTITTLLILLLTTTLSAQAEPGVQLTQPEIDYIFGEHLHLETQIQSETPISQVTLFLKPEGETKTITTSAPMTTLDRVIHEVDLIQNPIRAFSIISYYYEVNLDNGETFTSPTFTFFYDDNHFDWQMRESGAFRVHWYQGDVEFAQTVLDIAYEGLQKIQSTIPVPQPEQIDIYVYDSAMDMQSTILMSGQSWIAGHADPDLNVIVVSLPPGPAQVYETKRQIPHELLHVMLYQQLGPGYRNLPKWLNEGLASISELFPNPDYQLLLANAYEMGTLISIDELCQAFPVDASSIQLSYAESTSFTRYLHQQYGNQGVESLLSQYANGLGCERGVEVALGVPLSKLEQDWRRVTFNEHSLSVALETLSPWLLLFILVLFTPTILVIRGLRKKGVKGAAIND